MLTHPFQALSHSPRDRGLGNALGSSNLRHALPLQKMLDQQVAVILGQFLQGRIHQGAYLRPGTFGCAEVPGIGVLATTPRLVLPDEIDSAPSCHLMEPSAWRPGDALRSLEQLEKGLLGYVGRLEIVPQNPQTRAINHVGVAT